MLTALFSLFLQAQADDTVHRNDPNRAAYQDAVDACKEAEGLLPGAPDLALEKLSPVFANGIDKGRFSLVERRIFIERKSQEFSPHEFFPYYLRGRARLLAASQKKEEEARRLLLEAAADFDASIARGAARSAEPRAEVEAKVWESVKRAVGFQGWKRERLLYVDQALAFLGKSDRAKEAGPWIASEIDRVAVRLRELRKEPGDPDAKRPLARQAVDWCDALGASLKASGSFPNELAAVTRAGTLALSIRDSRGRFRLKIGVSPWATVERLEREGEVIPLEDRDTPLLVPGELEIDDYLLVLAHPKGRKTARISAKSLEPGRTYVLWGDMGEGKFEIAELSK